MTINRNGIEYELTFDEMLDIYHEMDKSYLKEDITSRMEGIACSKDDLEYIAQRVKKALDNNESYWESYWMTIEYVIESYEAMERRAHDENLYDTMFGNVR